MLELAAKIVLSVAAECSGILSRSHLRGRLRRGSHRLLVSQSLSQVEVKVLISKKALILLNGPSVRQRCLWSCSFRIVIADY